MSKIKALITALVLGSSSVAAAAPSLTFSAHAEASWGTVSPNIRDHRTVTTYQAPSTTVMRGTWISLAEPTNMARGRAIIDINSRSALNQIRLQSASGSSYIGTVTVQYVNGASQVITLNKWIDARNPMAQFNLNRTTQVDSILINGQRNARGGKVQVFGYASSTTPTRPTPPVYQPPAYQPPVYQPPVYQPPMQSLATGLNFLNTSGGKRIDLSGTNRFSTLRIQGVTGQTFIKQIDVYFANGQEQRLNVVDRMLLPGQLLDVPLDGRGANAVTTVIVYTNDTQTPVQTLTGTINVSAL